MLSRRARRLCLLGAPVLFWKVLPPVGVGNVANRTLSMGVGTLIDVEGLATGTIGSTWISFGGAMATLRDASGVNTGGGFALRAK